MNTTLKTLSTIDVASEPLNTTVLLAPTFAGNDAVFKASTCAAVLDRENVYWAGVTTGLGLDADGTTKKSTPVILNVPDPNTLAVYTC